MNIFVLENTKRRFLKPITLSFIFANIVDLVSTVIALSLGHYAIEKNIIVNSIGWEFTIIFKIFAVIFWSWFFEKFWIPKFFWIAPAIVWLVSLWNTIMIFVLLLII